MKLQILYKHIKHSESVEEKIKKKVQKLTKYMWKDPSVKWTSTCISGQNITDVDITDGSIKFHASAKHENLYKTFDLVIDKLDKQLSKNKERVKDKMHTRQIDLTILDPEEAWGDKDEDRFDDVKS